MRCIQNVHCTMYIILSTLYIDILEQLFVVYYSLHQKNSHNVWQPNFQILTLGLATSLTNINTKFGNLTYKY